MRAPKAFLLVVCGLGVAAAGVVDAGRVMENLGRGVVAIRTSGSDVYVGWRLLADEPANLGFNVYRSTAGAPAVKVNGVLVTLTTDFVDATADLTRANAYFVRAVRHGVEQAPSAAFTLPANAPVRQYLELPIVPPPGGRATCATSTSSYSYSANDGSIADLDGDGHYEIVLKWDPSNARDNAQDGCTGPTVFDAYEFDGGGTRLWRIDLGPNIRSGAHYTQFIVYDFDGDGRAEVVLKTADGTVDGRGTTIGDPTARWANDAGRILTGPEYLTVFDGATGAALDTIDFRPARGAVTDWGDNYGNRVDRFLAAAAYFDGVRPSILMTRGYYARTTLAAWDFRNGRLTLRWEFDSRNPARPEHRTYEGQGNHQLAIADVDGDGRDEIVFGSAVIDDDGTGMFSTGWGHGDALHVSRFDPTNPDLQVYTVHEIDWIDEAQCRARSQAAYPLFGTTLYNARTGAPVMLTDECVSRDVGRGMAAPLDPNRAGAQFWGGLVPGGLVDLFGVRVGNAPGSVNHAAWWDADLLRELVDGVAIQKYDIGSRAANGSPGVTRTILTCPECASNNGTKQNPVWTGDLIGDWREEVIWRTADNRSLRIYTTTIPATSRLHTFLQDPQYRLALVWQNVAYNQPPWPSFYVGPGMDPPQYARLRYPVEIAGEVASVTGPGEARVWTLEIRNTGTAVARAVEIWEVNLAQTAGAACTPIVLTPTEVPLALGDLAPGARAVADVTIDFSACGADARFELKAPLSAMSGAATAIVQ